VYPTIDYFRKPYTHRVSSPDLSGCPQGLWRWPSYALGQLHRLATTRLDATLGEQDLSLRTYAVLACLDESGKLSQQQVADRVAIDRSDLVKLLDQLEALGHVMRRPDPDDRRRHILILTAAGTQAVRQAEQAVGQATDDVFANLTAEERHTLHRLTLRALGKHCRPPG
jgi:MarR family transcriptional regulator, lower aerobic nicotinate degradation pathway regulator